MRSPTPSSFFARAEIDSALVSRSAVPDRDAILAETWDGELRTRLVGELAAAGTPTQVATTLRSLLDAGADSLALWVFPSDEPESQLRLLAGQVLPLL